MTRYILHATLNTGDVVRQNRADATIATVAALIDSLLIGGAPDLPGFAGYTVRGANSGRNLIATLYTGADLILTTAVCVQSRSSPRLWRMMHDSANALATDPARPPTAPWIADRIEPGAADHIDAKVCISRWSRALGWAWMEYDR